MGKSLHSRIVTEMNKKNSPKISASMICSHAIDFKKNLSMMKKGGMDYLHFDVMDGVFVPRLGLHPELLQEIKKECDIPVDVHLMVSNPESHIKVFADAGADIITIHAESCLHLDRTIRLIKSFGVQAGVALNPATPLNVLDYVIDELSVVMIMLINPGIIGHKLLPKSINKISEVKNKYPDANFLIQVDGGVTFENTRELVDAGADILVGGSSTVFNKSMSVSKQIKKFRKKLILK